MEGDWLAHKRTRKNRKGLVKTDKDWLGHKRTSKDRKGQVRT